MNDLEGVRIKIRRSGDTVSARVEVQGIEEEEPISSINLDYCDQQRPRDCPIYSKWIEMVQAAFAVRIYKETGMRMTGFHLEKPPEKT